MAYCLAGNVRLRLIDTAAIHYLFKETLYISLWLWRDRKKLVCEDDGHYNEEDISYMGAFVQVLSLQSIIVGEGED